MTTPRDGYLQNGEVTIHYVEAGIQNAPLVVLLHGFPSFWYTWKNQIGFLSEQGFHVVAPDLRGYNLSSKPRDTWQYGRDPLLTGVLAILDHCSSGNSKSILVGHDWGGLIAWHFAHAHPDRLSHLIIMNIPHPQVLRRALQWYIRQMLRSSYIVLLSLPFVGEMFVSFANFAVLKKVIQDDPVARQSEEHTQLHVDAFSRPGALTAALQYYRAAWRHWGMPRGDRPPKIDVPVLVLHGDKDWAFESSLADPPSDVVPRAKVVHFHQASHWVIWDQPDAVNSLMQEFYRRHNRLVSTFGKHCADD